MFGGRRRSKTLTTGLDYALNRYYSAPMGRFLSAVPYGGSMDPENPQSFNRYAYVMGDPVNGNDPTGLGGENDGAFYCVINGMAWPNIWCSVQSARVPPITVDDVDDAHGKLTRAEKKWVNAVTKLSNANDLLHKLLQNASPDCQQDIADLTGVDPALT